MQAVLTVVLLAALQPTDAAFLRASPVVVGNKSSNSSTTNQSADQAATVSAVMDMVGSMQAELKPHHAAAAPGNGTQRAKLDVGFTGYEKNMTEQLVAIMRKSTPSPQWTNASRERLIANVTANISLCLKEKLKAMKQSVGKTWMALPEDEQKNLYVSQLKSQFEPAFGDAMTTIMSHFGRSGTRVEAYLKDTHMAPEELLTRSEETFAEAVVSERCYGSDAFLQLSLLERSEATFVAAPAAAKAPTSKDTNSTKKKLGRFCLPSSIERLVNRLNDAQGLLSMTMRFEARAMDMLQKGKKGAKATK